MGRAHGVPVIAPATSAVPAGSAGLGKRLLSSVLLLPLFVWIVVWGPAWAFTALVIGVGAIGQWEFSRMFRRADVAGASGLGLVAGTAVTASFAFPEALPPVLTGAVMAVLVGALARGGRDIARAWAGAAVTVLGIGYVNLLLGHALWLHGLPDGVSWVLLLVLVTWVGETAAYVVGSTMGRHPLAPVVSPRKTIEGAVAQLLVSPLAAAAASAWLFPERRLVDAVALGVLLGVAGQVGDLVESLLKRSVGAKDTGQMLPGHGGMLDRIDGLLFNAPVLFYYVWATRGLHA
ncbi:MAG: phosphatidate cytidylyltransferase [Candidatus Rokubacteria bacterium]|nr:phosphatidate cytidylyltransferase [Candidatus Rokubacteria bacterium]